MPLFNVQFKVKTEGLEFVDEILIPAKDAKKARSLFDTIRDRNLWIKGRHKGRDIIYVVGESAITITKVELFKE